MFLFILFFCIFVFGQDQCKITPSFTDGPFYLATSASDYFRRDITENHVGNNLTVRIQLVNASSCLPLSNIDIDLWHATPAGEYTGVDGVAVENKTFPFRGRQRTDDQGRVEFFTKYPGWYPGTIPHLHFTAPFGWRASFTWQFFFNDEFSASVFEFPAYSSSAGFTNRLGNSPALAERAINPTGSPDNGFVDAVVSVDLSKLGRPACPFGTEDCSAIGLFPCGDEMVEMSFPQGGLGMDGKIGFECPATAETEVTKQTTTETTKTETMPKTSSSTTKKKIESTVATTKSTKQSSTSSFSSFLSFSTSNQSLQVEPVESKKRFLIALLISLAVVVILFVVAAKMQAKK